MSNTATTSKRKFYKTVYSVEVLSEEPIEDIDAFVGLKDLHYMITDGDCVGRTTFVNEVVMTGKETADALHKIASKPGFFMLDDDGNDTDPGEDKDEDENYSRCCALLEKYQKDVESGNYKSHAQMIKLYKVLLEKVHPVDMELRNRIMEEIEDHECDEMADRMDL